MEATTIRWVIIAAIAPVAWGSTYVVTRLLLPADYPLWGGAIRALPAGLLLLLIARSRPHGQWWWKSLVLGTVNVGAFFALVYAAAQLLPSGVAATLMATSPVVMMLLAWPLLAERPRAASFVGAGIGIAGVCLLVAGESGTIRPLGVVASLAAMLMSSVGYVLTKRWGGGVDVLSLTSWQLIAGGIMLVPVAVLVEGAPPTLDAPTALGFAYVSIVATAVAFWAWFTGLRHLTAGAVGVIGLLNPVTGVALGALIGAEIFGLPQLAGMILVGGGILVSQVRRSGRARTAQATLVRRGARKSGGPGSSSRSRSVASSAYSVR